MFRLIHQRRQLGRQILCVVNDYLPDVQAWNPAHASRKAGEPCFALISSLSRAKPPS
jgi:hypothetical protein